MTTSTAPLPRYAIGVDLAFSVDYTAIAVLEQLPDTPYRLRHLERLQRVEYTDIGAHLRDLVAALRTPVDFEERPPRDSQGRIPIGVPPERVPRVPDATVVFDYTGVGVAVRETFEAAKIGAPLIGVSIHGGDKTSYADGISRVPKVDLVSTLVVAFQNQALTITPSLPLTPVLVGELTTFSVKRNPETMHESFAAWREGDHDDLVLAAALAVWWAEQPQPPTAAPTGIPRRPPWR